MTSDELIIICPDLSIETKQARQILKDPYDLSTVVEHSANLASTISALYTQDLDVLSASLKKLSSNISTIS